MKEKKNFSAIYILFKDKIYNLCYKLTGNKDIAKDIAQETFLKYYENIDKLRGDSSVSTWLYAVAKNSCFQFLKMAKRIKAVDLENLLKTGYDDNEMVLSVLEKNNYINQVKEGCLLGLLRTLSLNQRMAFILHFLYKLPTENISKILNKSESATRTLIHRARKNVKEFLCENCSLYDRKNVCKCEGMINFSLKKGWIKYDEEYDIDLPEVVLSELNEFRKISELYKSIPNHELSTTLFDGMKQQNFLIFSDKKVK